jgi:hypothetical protein
MSTKFEQLLDYLVNEEQDKANELFHEIVVEKSREIYENLIAEEEKEEEEMDEASEQDDDESVDEAASDDEEMDESYEEEAVESIMGEEGDEEEFPVQDKTDDAEDDFGAELGDEEDEEDGEEPATKDDIQDLEDALDELKAEFEALMAAEKHEEEEEPGVHGEPSPLDNMDGMDADKDEAESMMSLESTDDEEEMEKDVQESRVVKTQGERMREYIEKISVTMTDGEGVGSGRGDKAGQTGHDSGKSPISSGSGKPQSGANANNLAQAGKGSNEDGTSPKGKVGGLVKTGGDFVKAGTKNVASSANTKKPDGSKLTGVSKPASGEGKPVGAGTGQNNVSGATNTKSIVDKKIG